MQLFMKDKITLKLLEEYNKMTYQIIRYIELKIYLKALLNISRLQLKYQYS